MYGSGRGEGGTDSAPPPGCQNQGHMGHIVPRTYTEKVGLIDLKEGKKGAEKKKKGEKRKKWRKKKKRRKNKKRRKINKKTLQ